MAISHSIEEDYFEWLFEITCDDGYSDEISFRKLLLYLHNTEFRWLDDYDASRYKDGIDLRYRYATTELNDPKRSKEITGRCSVLEMIVAFAIKIEGFMDDTAYGNRTSQWIWVMINSLGLGHMYNNEFNEAEAHEKIERFLDGDYSPDGLGGLFHIPGYREDLRRKNLWAQMCAYAANMV